MMKHYRRGWTAVLGIAILSLAAAAAAEAAVEGSFERTLRVTGPVDLDISTGSGKIRVSTGTASEVHVYGRIRANNSWWGGGADAEEKVRYLEKNPPIEQDGNRIRIGRIEERAYRNNVSIEYEVVVPEETRLVSKTGSGRQSIEGIRGPVEADTGSGGITISRVGDEVRAQTGSGEIEIDSVQGGVRAGTGSGSIRAIGVAGPIRAETGSGRITLEQTAPGDVEVSTGSGSIEATGIRGAFTADTGSGSITASGTPTGNWDVSAGSGGVTLRFSRDAAFDLYARSNSGSIRVDREISVTGRIERREIRGKVNGGGPLVEVHSGSGTIVIQ